MTVTELSVEAYNIFGVKIFFLWFKILVLWSEWNVVTENVIVGTVIIVENEFTVYKLTVTELSVEAYNIFEVYIFFYILRF